MFEQVISNIVTRISDRVSSSIVAQITDRANEPVVAFFIEYQKFGIVDARTLANARAALGLNDPIVDVIVERLNQCYPSSSVSINDVVPMRDHNDLKKRLLDEHRDQMAWATKTIELQKIIDALRAENDKLRAKE